MHCACSGRLSPVIRAEPAGTGEVQEGAKERCGDIAGGTAGVGTCLVKALLSQSCREKVVTI